MSKQEIEKLLKQIKVFYPRFDAVEKCGDEYQASETVVDAWYQRIGWMDYDRAVRILDRHMESEGGGKVPNINIWMSGGKQQQSSDWCSAIFQRRTGTIRWQPEPDGQVFEKSVTWNAQHGAYEDEDGYYWALPED